MIIASVNSENKIFVQRFRINDQVDSEKVVFKLGQGILKVTLPKKEQVKPKKIKIELEP